MEHTLTIDEHELSFEVTENSRLGHALTDFEQKREALSEVFEGRIDVLREKADAAEEALNGIDWHTTPEQAFDLWREWSGYSVLVSKLSDRATADVNALIDAENLSARTITITPETQRPQDIRNAVRKAAEARAHIGEVETAIRARLRSVLALVAGTGLHAHENPTERAWRADNAVQELGHYVGADNARDVARAYLSAHDEALPERPKDENAWR